LVPKRKMVAKPLFQRFRLARMLVLYGITTREESSVETSYSKAGQ